MPGTNPLPNPPVAWIDLKTGQPTQAFYQYILQLDGSLGGTGGSSSGTSGLPSTGDLKPTHKTTADPGWILWSDGTIGDPSSGASILSATTAAALFTLYYNSYSDARCPLLTSGGGATTRGAQGTAAQAFAAHCRMTLPKGSSRSLALAGAGAGLTSRTPGDVAGAETETPTIAKTASHSHTQSNTGGAASALSQYDPNANFTFGGANGVAGTTIDNTGSGVALNVLDPSAYINIMIKL